MTKKLLQLFAILLLLMNGTGAVYGGWSLITDPTGKSLQLPAQWLNHTPLSNFYIPGLLLFFINGVFSYVIIMFTVASSKYSSILICIEGILLTGWIIAELLLTRMYDTLQVVMGVIGILLILIGLKLFRTAKYSSTVNSL